MAKKSTEFSPVAFLTEELGIEEAQAVELAKAFDGEPASKLKAAVKRQQDYSRAMDEGRAELATKAQELEAQNERLSSEMAQWASMTSEEQARATELRTSIEKHQARGLKLQQKVERLATAAGLDPGQILAEIDQESPMPSYTPPQPLDQRTTPAPGYTPPPQQGYDQTAIATLAQMTMSVPAELHVIAREHKALTGEDLDPREIVAEVVRRAQTKGNTKPVDIRAVWEETHEIADKRTSANEAAIQRRIDAARAEGREAAMSENNVPGPRTFPGAHTPSPVLTNRQSVLDRHQPLAAVSAAAAALRSGRYRSGADGAAPPASS